MAVLVLACSAMGSIEGKAATITWDAVGGNNGTLEDGGGTWDTSLANWTLNDGGTNLPFVSGDNVIFGEDPVERRGRFYSGKTSSSAL